MNNGVFSYPKVLLVANAVALQLHSVVLSRVRLQASSVLLHLGLLASLPPAPS